MSLELRTEVWVGATGLESTAYTVGRSDIPQGDSAA